MVLYNFSHVMQANSTLEILSSMANITPWMPMGFAVAIFLVLMLSFKSDDIPTLMMVSGFFTTSIAGMMWLAGFMPFIVIIFSMLLMVAGFFISYFTNS